MSPCPSRPESTTTTSGCSIQAARPNRSPVLSNSWCPNSLSIARHPKAKREGRLSRIPKFGLENGSQVLEVRFLIRADSRCKHDGDVKLFAGELIKRGFGEGAIASKLAIPKGTAGKWVLTYQAIGLDGLLNGSMSIFFFCAARWHSQASDALEPPTQKDALPSDAVFTQ